MLALKDLLAKLVAFSSITPNDAGCQEYIIAELEAIGFKCDRYNQPPVSNFFARIGNCEPLLVFAGHTDVVPAGDHAQWHSNPYCLHEQDGMLYGRGTADMKGSIASMMLAAKRLIDTHPSFTGSLGFLITSGEEGDDFNLGTPYVMEQLKLQNTMPTFCIVGEPSSNLCLADMIKIGRRGSLSATIKLCGKQGHVAYPHLAENPIHKIAPLLAELTHIKFDNGNEYFPPTSLQITQIKAGGGAGNIIPGELMLELNCRYSNQHTDISLRNSIEACFERHLLKPHIDWRLNGEPFLTTKGLLLQGSIAVILAHTAKNPELSTSGGTSDGRFIAPYGIEVIELGAINATIHQVNECVSLDDLVQLSSIYYGICEIILVKNKK